MDVMPDYSVVSFIKAISEKVFSAQTDCDYGLKKLIVSVPVENKEKICFKFYEDFFGYPILILNKPEIFSRGKSERFYQWLMLFLEWQYKKKLPKPREYDFNGHQFLGWQPNSKYPIVVYLWNNKGIKEFTINKLILGLYEKEVD